MSASCTSLGRRVSSSMRTMLPRSMARHDRRRHERPAAGPFGQQAGVVPAVAHGLFGGAGGALHQQRRVAADGRGQVLADPGLGGAGQAEQQQGAVGGQRGDRRSRSAAAAPMYFGDDDRAVVERAAHQVRDDRPRRQLPVGGPWPAVGADERSELGGELDLGVRPQDLARFGRECWRCGCGMWEVVGSVMWRHRVSWRKRFAQRVRTRPAWPAGTRRGPSTSARVRSVGAWNTSPDSSTTSVGQPRRVERGGDQPQLRGRRPRGHAVDEDLDDAGHDRAAVGRRAEADPRAARPACWTRSPRHQFGHRARAAPRPASWPGRPPGDERRDRARDAAGRATTTSAATPTEAARPATRSVRATRATAPRARQPGSGRAGPRTPAGTPGAGRPAPVATSRHRRRRGRHPTRRAITTAAARSSSATAGRRPSPTPATRPAAGGGSRRSVPTTAVDTNAVHSAAAEAANWRPACCANAGRAGRDGAHSAITCPAGPHGQRQHTLGDHSPMT